MNFAQNKVNFCTEKYRTKSTQYFFICFPRNNQCKVLCCFLSVGVFLFFSSLLVDKGLRPPEAFPFCASLLGIIDGVGYL